MDKILATLADVFGKLSLPRVLLAIMLGVGGVFVYTMWETRSDFVPSILQSQSALLSIAGFLAALLLGLLWDTLQRRIDARTDAVQALMQSELEKERAERRSLYDIVLRQAAELGDLRSSEKECRERVRALQQAFMDSGFGPIPGHT